MIQRTVMLLAALLLSGGLSAAELSREFLETFDAEGVEILHVKHHDGEVRVVPWEHPRIEISVRYRLDYRRFGLADHPTFDVEFTRRGPILEVIDREIEPRGWHLGYYDSSHAEHLYEIRAPAGLILDVDGDDGLVTIEGWRGEIDVTSDEGDIKLHAIDSPRTIVKVADGDVEIDGLRGELTLYGQDPDFALYGIDSPRCRIEVEDGTVVMDDGRGRFDLESEDGDFLISGYAAESLVAKSNQGRIELGLARAASFEIVLVTDRGDLVVEVEPGLEFEFDLQTGAGSLELDLPGVAAPDSGARRAQGKTPGDASTRSIRIRSEGGDVSLREELPPQE